ncbi:MAG: polysaccharide biosynthesis protein, partial [Lachnospiraceae bacterium]|nr:polysaccharide biosynthesis protein [Lachnospiraceae bacterium]
LICRVIGLLYRVPMIGIIGTVGNGYYTSAYSIYSLFLIISSYSFPTAISKIISTKFAMKRFVDVKKIIRCAFILAFFVGSIMFCIMYFGADVIAISLQKPHLVVALQVLSPTLFIMAFLSVYRGIFQGMCNMVSTAISNVFEQIFNAITSIVFAYVLFSRGMIANVIYNEEDYHYAYGAAGGAIGTGVGAFVALVILFFMFLSFNRRYRQLLKYNNQYTPESTGTIYHDMFMTIIPIILSSTIYNISSVLDDTIFSNVMVFMREKENIISLWGVYGQYHILFNIPVAIASSLTSSIIPSISKAVSQNNAREVVDKIKYSKKYTLLIVLPSFVGLTILAEPICKILFNGENVHTLINVLRIGAIAVVFFSLSTVTSGILQGLSNFRKPVENAFISLIIHIIVLVILMTISSIYMQSS